MFSLEGRVALVTGASSGFGEHFARVLAEAGADVVVAARRKERLDALADALRADGHVVEAVAMDVADDASVAEAFAGAEAAMGGRAVDLLINNAGIASPNLFLEIDSSEFDELMGTNLRGAFFVAQQFCRRLVDRGQPGSIVNISSILGQRTGSRQSIYGASKAALDQLTRNLAMELARSGEPPSPPNPHHHHHPPTDRPPARRGARRDSLAGPRRHPRQRPGAGLLRH